LRAETDRDARDFFRIASKAWKTAPWSPGGAVAIQQLTPRHQGVIPNEQNKSFLQGQISLIMANVRATLGLAMSFRTTEQNLEDDSSVFFLSKSLKSPKTAKFQFGIIWSKFAARFAAQLIRKGFFWSVDLSERQSKDFADFWRNACPGVASVRRLPASFCSRIRGS
jgi:hypothetical protein